MFRLPALFKLSIYFLFVFASCNSESSDKEKQESSPVASDVKLIDGHPG